MTLNIENLKTRLNYAGGANQQKRMNEDKLKSLKKALIYSYQAATAILSDGREFRCLINPNKISLDLDNKILSIPFEDVCLNKELSEPQKTTDGIELVNIKEGDTFEWKENGSHWIVYLQRLEETAYFRADIRRCRYEAELENGSKYWVYVRGPVEQSILWSQGGGNFYNKLNNTIIIYITKNEETENYFYRFKKLTINNKPWEVQAVDNISTPGIIEVSLKETYTNTPEKDIEKAVEEAVKKEEIPTQNNSYIYGLDEVYPYDVRHYELKNYGGDPGTWKIMSESRKNMIKLQNISPYDVTIQIITGKSGSFTLAYEVNGEIVFNKDIVISSL